MTIQEKLAAIKAYIAARGFHYEGNVIENFYISLKSKPFVILAGTSGTGVEQILGPELTDKFAMFRVTDGGRLALTRPACVAVVTGGAGMVNGLSVAKGDRLVVAEESELAVAGSAEVVVCI